MPKPIDSQFNQMFEGGSFNLLPEVDPAEFGDIDLYHSEREEWEETERLASYLNAEAFQRHTDDSALYDMGGDDFDPYY